MVVRDGKAQSGVCLKPVREQVVSMLENNSVFTMDLSTTLAFAFIHLPFGVVMYIEGGLKGNSGERKSCKNIQRTARL